MAHRGGYEDERYAHVGRHARPEETSQPEGYGSEGYGSGGYAQSGQHGYAGGGQHETSHSSEPSPQINGQVLNIVTRADSKFSLGVNGDSVVVVTSNDSDPYQQWIKDESWSNKAQDSAGHPAFALINKGSGKALTHPDKVEEKVHLSTYHQNSLDEQVLWTSAEAGHEWHALRAVTNVHFNLDIDHGSKKYGGIHDGQAVIVFTWKDEENQHWKLTPISSSTSHDHHHKW